MPNSLSECHRQTVTVFLTESAKRTELFLAARLTRILIGTTMWTSRRSHQDRQPVCTEASGENGLEAASFVHSRKLGDYIPIIFRTFNALLPNTWVALTVNNQPWVRVSDHLLVRGSSSGEFEVLWRRGFRSLILCLTGALPPQTSKPIGSNWPCKPNHCEVTLARTTEFANFEPDEHCSMNSVLWTSQLDLQLTHRASLKRLRELFKHHE